MAYKEDIAHIATLKDLPWEKLNGCNILVTGATGLIGSCLVEVLMTHPGKGYHLYASGRNEERARELFSCYLDDCHFHFVQHDVTRPLESNIDFHYIIHAASNASPNSFATKPVDVMMSNFMGVAHLLDYGKAHHLRRFLFVSSGEVYGEGDGRTFTEDYSGYVDCTKPRSCYPSSKRAAETLCVSYSAQYGVDVVIARLSHVYGPHFTETDNRVYAQFIRNVLNGDDIVMKSTGCQFRSWCYVTDCVSALLYVLLKGKSREAYNVADTSSNISIRQLAEMIAKITDKQVIFDLPTETERQGYNVVSKSVFSTQKLEGLGWNVQGKMEEKVAGTINELSSRYALAKPNGNDPA